MKAEPLVNRLKSGIYLYSIRDYENSFINIFIALDITAKKRYPKQDVGIRNRQLLSDTESLTQKFSTGHVLRGLNINGLTFPKIFYKFGRNALIHDGALDNKLSISDEKGIRIGVDRWDFHHSYIISMAIAIIACEENANFDFHESLEYKSRFGAIDLNSLWGKEKLLKFKLSIPD
ncbi:hypothetical protein [Enterobacter cloacae complex sp. 326A8]|uniref:hypothetical protein n=1 Tax=Enterobacter cloacae complex sp. 326A8 TaxID=3395871 RepID=UPI003CE755B6